MPDTNDPPVDVPQPSDAADAPAPAGGAKAGDAKASPRRRSRAFRQGLLAKLPTLAVPRWEAADTLDVYQDMQGIVDVDADAFLQPLERLAGERHG